MSKKTCKNCHDLKTLKKELQQSYDNFKQLASNASERETNLMARIDALEKEIEYFENISKKQCEALYKLQCENESLRFQNESQPGLATVNRYREDMISAVKEKAKFVQIAAIARRKEVEAENKATELQTEIVRLQERLEDAWSRQCYCNDV